MVWHATSLTFGIVEAMILHATSTQLVGGGTNGNFGVGGGTNGNVGVGGDTNGNVGGGNEKNGGGNCSGDAMVMSDGSG